MATDRYHPSRFRDRPWTRARQRQEPSGRGSGALLLLLLLLLTGVLLSLLPGAPLAAADASVEPDPQEILALQLLNEHRRSYRLGDMRIIDLIRRKILPGDMSSAGAQFSEGFPPTAPLVINPQLMLAARALLKTAPPAENGTPYDCTPFLRDAAYPATPPVFALVGLDAADLAQAYGKALLFPYRVTDKRVGIFSRKMALADTWREAGVAVQTVAGRTSLAIILGAGTARRYGGGVVYADRNRNGAYDPGEGQAGVTVTSGSTSFTTGAGGAWWMPLASADPGAAVEITFAGAGLQAVRGIPAGTANIGLDWRFPLPADLATADRLIAACRTEQKIAAQRRLASAKLYFEARGLAVDDQRLKQMQELMSAFTAEGDAIVAKTLRGFSEEPDEWRKIRAELEQPWKGALRKWFQDAEATYQTAQAVKSARAAPPEKQDRLVEAARKLVERRLAATIDPAFIDQLLVWSEQLAAIQPVGNAKAAPAKR